MLTHTEKAMWGHSEKSHVRTQWEGRHLQARERPQEKPNLLTPWSWPSSLWNCEKINFCCLSLYCVVFCYGSPSRPTHPHSFRLCSSKNTPPVLQTQQKGVNNLLNIFYRHTVSVQTRPNIKGLFLPDVSSVHTDASLLPGKSQRQHTFNPPAPGPPQRRPATQTTAGHALPPAKL